LATISTPNRRDYGIREVIFIKQPKLTLPIPDGFKLVFRPWITLRNGKKLYASQVGKRAFPLVVPVSE